MFLPLPLFLFFIENREKSTTPLITRVTCIFTGLFITCTSFYLKASSKIVKILNYISKLKQLETCAIIEATFSLSTVAAILLFLRWWGVSRRCSRLGRDDSSDEDVVFKAAPTKPTLRLWRSWSTHKNTPK